MGFFSFIKSAGKKLGIGGDEEAPDASAVKKELESHGLGTESVEVEVVDDKVVLKGAVKDQSIFEKAVVAVGNTLGIATVEASDLKVGSSDAAEPVFHTVKKATTFGRLQKRNMARAKAPNMS